MAFLHLPVRALSFRPLLTSLRHRTSAPVHDDLLRAGQEPVRRPAYMTLMLGGRPTRS
jgi:hypothetical protein